MHPRCRHFSRHRGGRASTGVSPRGQRSDARTPPATALLPSIDTDGRPQRCATGHQFVPLHTSGSQVRAIEKAQGPFFGDLSDVHRFACVCRRHVKGLKGSGRAPAYALWEMLPHPTIRASCRNTAPSPFPQPFLTTEILPDDIRRCSGYEARARNLKRAGS